MTKRSRAVGMLAAGVLTAGLLPGTAAATPSAATEACTVNVGSVTAGGDHRFQIIAATTPPTRSHDRIIARDLYADGGVRLSGPMVADANAGGPEVAGFVIVGDALYASDYDAGFNGEILSSSLRRIGGGWGGFAAFDESIYSEQVGTYPRRNTYGLRNDGVLFRWTVDAGGVWRNRVSAPGFGAVKSMALISKTRTYDTFLANLRGGSLYTIRIPATSPMKPVVKPVRRSTWQGFESLVGAKCGQYGTLLLGIDKDTQAGYLYAVGHANGTSTVIQSRGKVPLTFNDPVYFRWAAPIDPLFGE